jgi:hypothetical protein
MILVKDNNVRKLAISLEVQRAGFMIRYYEPKRVVKADEEEQKNHCDYLD